MATPEPPTHKSQSIEVPNRIIVFSFLIPDYDEAIAFFTTIGFDLNEDTDLGDEKRCVRISPSGVDTDILVASATNAKQSANRAGVAPRCSSKLSISTQITPLSKPQAVASKVPHALNPMAASPSGPIYGAIAGT